MLLPWKAKNINSKSGQVILSQTSTPHVVYVIRYLDHHSVQCSLWQVCDDTSLHDALNYFYAWFEAQINVPVEKITSNSSDQVLCLHDRVLIQQTSGTLPNPKLTHGKVPVLTTYLVRCSGNVLVSCPYRHFQHLPEPSGCSCVRQDDHHHPCAEEICCVLPEWLTDHCTHTYHHEVLWVACHETHKEHKEQFFHHIGPIPVCLPP